MHALIIDQTGGRHGVRDIGLLQAACARPFTAIGGRSMFASTFDKAAVFLDSFARYHAFTDGNKRTAIVVCARYLSLHGIEFVATQKQLVNYIMSVVEQHPEIEAIAQWLEDNSRRQK